MKKTAAALTAALLMLTGLPVFAEGETMALRLSAEKTTFLKDEIEEDQMIHGGLYIDNYTGISKIRVVLTSDAPLHIENGGFTLDTSDPEKTDQLALFNKYSTAMYTRESLIDDSENIATFVGPENYNGGSFILNGELRDPDSSFVDFDVRIPKETHCGDYSCGISTFVRSEDIDGKTYYDPDFFAYDENKQLTAGEDILLQPMTFSVYLRGDVNCDEKVSVEDAQAALLYYTAAVVSHQELTAEESAELLGTKSIQAAKLGADASADGKLDSNDPQGILLYYTTGITGQSVSWSDIY